MLKHYPDLEVDVLKASQHGSKTSSSLAFLETLKPEFTLISVGKNNRTKLPHQETLTDWKISIVKFTELISKELYALKVGKIGKSKVFDRKDKYYILVK